MPVGGTQLENSEIARVFYEIADLLEIQGGDRFRIRSYRNAGMVVEGLPEGLKNLFEKDGEDGLKGIPGIGESTRAKIIEMLSTGKCKYHQELLKEMPVGIPVAQSFTQYLRAVPGIIDIVPSGSFRRWKETVGDLDILTTCKDSRPVMDHFVKHPDVREVLSKGETKSTVVLASGLHVDIRVLEKKSFGAALQYFTGSKAHNVALRDRAKRMGLKISE